MTQDKKTIDDLKIPRHIAVIMDGNGRWARKKGWPRIKGHEQGAQSVRCIINACKELGIKYLTLYAFSVENWVRPRDEIEGLMRLLDVFLRREEHELHKNKVRLRIIGRMRDLPEHTQKELNRVMKATRDYDDGHLILALSYGGRAELIDAIRKIGTKLVRRELEPEDIDEFLIAQHLYAPDVPDPDLMIRTSGEQRISNFLLWQLSYAELYFTDVLWPDFRKEHLTEALEVYSRRHRRFGDIK